MLASAAALSASAATVGPSLAAAPPAQPVILGQCSEQAAQVNGPATTDVNAQAGNGRITVGLDGAGTITVFKYPNPSYDNQVKYFTTGPDPSNGQPGGELPNEGSFAGLLFTEDEVGAPVTVVQWLKQPDLGRAGWEVSQDYASDETPVVVTTYRNLGLGLTVSDTDLANAAPLRHPNAPAAFVRRIAVQLADGSPVLPGSVELVYCEHFDAFGSRLRYFPVEDSCLQQFDDSQPAPTWRLRAGPATPPSSPGRGWTWPTGGPARSPSPSASTRARASTRSEWTGPTRWRHRSRASTRRSPTATAR
jgi:hypothetical protein